MFPAATAGSLAGRPTACCNRPNRIFELFLQTARRLLSVCCPALGQHVLSVSIVSVWCTGTEMTELMSVSCCLSRLISAVSRHDILQVIIPRLIAGPRPGTTDAGCRYRDGEEDGSPVPGADSSHQIERCHHNTAQSHSPWGRKRYKAWAGQVHPVQYCHCRQLLVFIVCCCVGIYYVWLQQQHHRKH